MRYILVILFMLTGLAGHCYAAGEQPADSGDSTTQPAASAPDDGKDKQKPADKNKDKKKPAEGEAEPDCE